MLLWSIRKCYGLLAFELQLARCQPLKIQGFGIFMLTQQPWYFYPQYLTNSNFKVSYFANILINFLLPSAENTKNEPFFDILMILTLAINIMIRQMTLLFSSTLWALSIGIFQFYISVQLYGVRLFALCYHL